MSIFILVSISVTDNLAYLVLIYILLLLFIFTSFISSVSCIKLFFINSFSICSKYILNPILEILFGTIDISISPSLVKKLFTIEP